MNIEEKEKVINDIFSKMQNKIEQRIQNHCYPKSMMAFYAKVQQIQLIKKSLNNSDGNFYSSQVLLRILLEHYLVAYYMYFKTISEKNDKIGEEYYNEYLKSEIIKQENYYKKLDEIKGELKHTDINGYLEKYKIFENMSQKEIDNIHQKASQFDIRKIIKYLFEHKGVNEKEKKLHNILFDFLEKYNKLSSYVHGGVSADAETFVNGDEKIRIQKIEENKEWGTSIESGIKFYFLYLLNINDKEASFELMKSYLK
jgi:hypothetical protein